MTIHQQLKALRTENNLTQRALANALHVSDKTISKWETGKSTPDINTLQRIADFFSVDIDNLLHKKTPNQTKSIKHIWLILLIPNALLYSSYFVLYPATNNFSDILLTILLIIAITAIFISLFLTMRLYAIGFSSKEVTHAKKIYYGLLPLALALIIIGLIKSRIIFSPIFIGNIVGVNAGGLIVDILFIVLLVSCVIYVKKHRFEPGPYQKLLWGLFALIALNHVINIASIILPIFPPFPFPWGITYGLLITVSGFALARYKLSY